MSIETILAYHQRTKHHFARVARGPGQLDWDAQPDPFRTYAGAPVAELPLVADALDTPYDALFIPGAVAPRQLTLESLAGFFELALGLSAWKEYRGSRWALRCDPSSGNLHPTEGYALVAGCAGLAPGLYHYVSRDHALERRWTPADASALAPLLPAGGFAALLTSIHWREAWKYGERAFRYCQHDAGHCIATVRYAAAAHGWSARLVEEPSDAVRSALCGLDRDADFAALSPHDREHADALIVVSPPGAPACLADDARHLTALMKSGTWSGRPNPLSPSHVDWPIIEDAAQATAKPETPPVPGPQPAACGPQPSEKGTTSRGPVRPLRDRAQSPLPAATLIRQRRSAAAMDGVTATDAATVFRILDALLPRPGVPPWDALPWPPHLHPALFVHRVDGLEPGFYLLERAPGFADRLRAACSEDFAWTRATAEVPLYLLATGDTRNAARAICCHQEIASDGAFAVGMLADFSSSIRARGAWWWRRLFWEAGVLGHVLYLESEAHGLRGTGIGCYFDDGFHDLFGLKDDAFQSLYHFTIGGAVEDVRIATRPPYAHLTGRTR